MYFILYLIFQTLMTSTSTHLSSSSSDRGQFSSIQVILPASWSGTECVNSNVTYVSSERNHHNLNADFTISEPHPIFGSEPFAEQYGSCGKVGKGVHIPYTALTKHYLGKDQDYLGKSILRFLLSEVFKIIVLKHSRLVPQYNGTRSNHD